MKSLVTSGVGRVISCLALAANLLVFSPSRLPAQSAATDQDLGALRKEVIELKTRLAELEAKLDAFSPAARSSGDSLMAHAFEAAA